MMSKANLLKVAFFAYLALIGFLVLHHVVRPAPGPTPDNFRRLRYGMSERTVLGILGEPATKYRCPMGKLYEWSGAQCKIWVSIRTQVDDQRPERGVRSGAMSFRNRSPF